MATVIFVVLGSAWICAVVLSFFFGEGGWRPRSRWQRRMIRMAVLTVICVAICFDIVVVVLCSVLQFIRKMWENFGRWPSTIDVPYRSRLLCLVGTCLLLAVWAVAKLRPTAAAAAAAVTESTFHSRSTNDDLHVILCFEFELHNSFSSCVEGIVHACIIVCACAGVFFV